MVLWSSGPAVLVLRCPGPLAFFQLSATFFVLALWFLWPPGLRVRWSPGHPIPVPLLFWFSSPAVFCSLDAVVLWSCTRFVSQFLALLVLWSCRYLVLMSRNCKLVSMGFVLVVRDSCCFLMFNWFSPDEGACSGCMMNRNRQMRGGV